MKKIYEANGITYFDETKQMWIKRPRYVPVNLPVDVIKTVLDALEYIGVPLARIPRAEELIPRRSKSSGCFPKREQKNQRNHLTRLPTYATLKLQ
jgi:hypothetical protein